MYKLKVNSSGKFLDAREAALSFVEKGFWVVPLKDGELPECKHKKTGFIMATTKEELDIAFKKFQANDFGYAHLGRREIFVHAPLPGFATLNKIFAMFGSQKLEPMWIECGMGLRYQIPYEMIGKKRSDFPKQSLPKIAADKFFDGLHEREKS